MLNNIKITNTTQLATGLQVNTCEMFLTPPMQRYFHSEIFPQFEREIEQGIHRQIGTQIQYYSFTLNQEQEESFSRAVALAIPVLQQQISKQDTGAILAGDNRDGQPLIG
ncbi:hypothetical protein [Larkinella terrae]|uniref:Uncharacterized protein n=1 Tax=Larkinella terrae TaxID=2025311 RepID=A0A7K0EU20_9BACT|nr:hypothetical protein [Larkinella terrae]MRS65310.1 hypothetical protein [Larkinella terrae]